MAKASVELIVALRETAARLVRAWLEEEKR